MENVGARLAARMARLVILCAAFVIPLVFYLNGNEAFETPKSWALRSLGAAAIAAVLWRGRPLRSRAAGGAALFLAVCLLSTLRTPLGMASAERLFELGALIVLAVSAEAGLVPADALLGTVLLSHFAVTVYGGLQYLGVDWINWTTFGDNRVYSTMGNPDFLGQQSSFLLPVMLGLLLGDRRGSLRVLMGACIALALPSVFYTGSRGGLIALFTAIPVFTWLAYRTVYHGTSSFWLFLRRVRWWAAAGAAVIVVVTKLASGNLLVERFKELLDPVRSSTIQTRLFYWYSGWLMGTDYHRTEATSPLAVAGSGIGAFHLAGASRQGQAQAIWDRKWPRAAEIVSPHLELYAHNDYVHLFAEIGPLGLGVYLWIMVALVAAAWAALARLPPGSVYARWRLIGLLAAVVSYYVNSATNFPLKVIANAHVFFGCVVVAMLRATSLPLLTIRLPRHRVATLAAAAAAVWLSARGAAKVCASHYLKLGHLHTQAGNAAQALDYFGRASRLAPIHTDAVLVHYYRGKALQNAGDMAGAIASFTTAVGIFRNFPEGLQGRGIAHSALAAQSAIGSTPYAQGVREGIADLESARALNPKDPLTVFFLGRAYRMAGAPALSVSPYADAIKYSGEKIPDAYYELALSYVEMKKPAEARAILETLMARFQSGAPPAARQLLARLGPSPRRPK